MKTPTNTDLINEFDSFWHNRPTELLRINNPTRYYKELSQKIANCGNVANIIDYVKALKSHKESTREIIVAFFQYLRDHDYEVESDLEDMVFYDYPFERQLEMAKYLHYKRTLQEIQDYFNIDKRTVQSDLLALEDGIDVLGAKIKIECIREGRKKVL